MHERDRGRSDACEKSAAHEHAAPVGRLDAHLRGDRTPTARLQPSPATQRARGAHRSGQCQRHTQGVHEAHLRQVSSCVRRR